MKTITRISQLAVTALLAGLAGAAQAQNDNEIRIGEYFVHYDAQGRRMPRWICHAGLESQCQRCSNGVLCLCASAVATF